METLSQLDEVREQQRTTWNRFSAGWKKWDDLTMRFLKPAGEAMIGSIQWKDHYTVLDVATGTGEPGLTVAAIVKNGKVIGTDLAEDMIEVAKENAGARGLKNYETRICSAESIPFEDGYFDVVLCRFGFMFFPDVNDAANEMTRVLKPGGRIAASVWSMPDKNDWSSAIMGIIKQYVEIPVPPPDAPGLFRCSRPGYMTDLFNKAGLKNITEKEITFSQAAETPELQWQMMKEVAAPVVAGLNKADEATKKKIDDEVLAMLRKYVTNGKFKLKATATIGYGEKQIMA